MKFVLWNIINYQHLSITFVNIIIRVALQEYKEYSKLQ